MLIVNRSLKLSMHLAIPSWFTGMALGQKETILNKHNRLKNPNWKEADQLTNLILKIITLSSKENANKDTCDGCLKIFQANSTGYLSCVPDTIPEKKQVTKLSKTHCTIRKLNTVKAATHQPIFCQLTKNLHLLASVWWIQTSLRQNRGLSGDIWRC